MKNKKFIIFFLFSFCLHGFIIGWLRLTPPSTIQTELVEIEIKKTSSIQRARDHKIKYGVLAQNNSHSLLKRFFKLSDQTLQGDLAVQSTHLGYKDGLPDNPLSNWGSGGSEFERVEEFPLMTKIHDKLDGLIYYPGILAYHQEQATVNARLVLDETGSCNWNYTKIESSNQHFKVFILSQLKKLCVQNFKSWIPKNKLTNVDLSFAFEITEHDFKEIKDEKNNKILGNVLFFYRNSQHSIAEWELGPLKGMFPIPMIYINFEWLQLNWDKYINKDDHLKDFKENNS